MSEYKILGCDTTTGRQDFLKSGDTIFGQVATPPVVSGLAKMFYYMYPGSPGENASTEFNADRVAGRKAYSLMPEYLAFDSAQANGIKTLTVAVDGVNAYNATNATDIITNSTETIITVSGSATEITTIMGSALAAPSRAAMVNFVTTNNFTGIGIDVEGFSGWTVAQKNTYIAYMTQLSTDLHAVNKKLLIYMPAIYSVANQTAYNNYKQEDMLAILADYYVIAAYDYYFDFDASVGGSPYQFIADSVNWTKAKFGISNYSKIVVGINSTGYSQNGPSLSQVSAFKTKNQMSVIAGYATATRDTLSDEMTWTSTGLKHWYSDTTTMNNKIAYIKNTLGIDKISVWVLGGNDRPTVL
jgi:hypothetical protein